jgi:glycosyltransferase involved in cell wall biosynthesis
MTPDPFPNAERWQRELTVVVPAYNEEDAIEGTLRSLRARLPEAEIVAVDDASTDRTLERALGVPGVRVVSHAYNCGYGGALKTGMTLSRRTWVAWFDADGEHRVEDLVAMVERADEGRLSAVIGQRGNAPSVSVRSIGKRLIRMVARSLDLRAGQDLNCGLRVFRRDVICRYLYLLPEGYSASTTSLMIMLERRYPVAFHPVTMAPRIGSSKVRLRDGFATIALVLRLAMLFTPLRVFARGGLLLFVLGLAYSLVVALRQSSGIPVAGALAMLTGVLLAAVGLIADQISQLRLIQLATLDSMPHRPVRLDTVAVARSGPGPDATREAAERHELADPS